MAAGRYDDAEKVVKEIGGVKEIMKADGVSAWNPSNTLGVWHPMMAYWNKMPFTGQYSLFTGVYGETLQALERLAVDDGRTEAAAGRLKDFIKTHELDKEQRSYLVDWYGRLSLAGKQSGSFLAHSNVSGYTWRSAFQVAMTGNYPDIAAALLELGFDYIADEAFPGATAIYLASIGSLPEVNLPHSSELPSKPSWWQQFRKRQPNFWLCGSSSAKTRILTSILMVSFMPFVSDSALPQ